MYEAGQHCHFNLMSWNVLSEKRADRMNTDQDMDRYCDPGYRRELFRMEFERMSEYGGGKNF